MERFLRVSCECMYIHTVLCTDIVTSTFALLFSSPSISLLLLFSIEPGSVDVKIQVEVLSDLEMKIGITFSVRKFGTISV